MGTSGEGGEGGGRGRERGRKPSSSKASVARAESAKRKARDEEVSSGDSGTPSFMEELMGTVGGEIVVPEGGLFRSRYDLSDEHGTILFGFGRRVEVAKALINLYCSPEGITKCRRIQSLHRCVELLAVPTGAFFLAGAIEGCFSSWKGGRCCWYLCLLDAQTGSMNSMKMAIK